MLEILNALAYANSRGYVHLDIKPEKINISREDGAFLYASELSLFVSLREQEEEEKKFFPLYA